MYRTSFINELLAVKYRRLIANHWNKLEIENNFRLRRVCRQASAERFVMHGISLSLSSAMFASDTVQTFHSCKVLKTQIFYLTCWLEIEKRNANNKLIKFT